MNMYIDLFMEKKGDISKRKYTIEEIVHQDKCAIILGAPGSGKTSLLQKYINENGSSFVKYQTVKEFIRLNDNDNKQMSIILLDGLDEYRNAPGMDKPFVTKELGNRLRRIGNVKIIICCRELDWYGEHDLESLKNELNGIEVSVYRILKLNSFQKNDLAATHGYTNHQKLQRYDDYGLLENPQMFVMFLRLLKDGKHDFTSKKDLYKEFIRNAIEEKNKHYFYNGLNIAEDQYFEILGYIAFLHLFSDIELNQLGSKASIEECGYTQEKINLVLHTSIFNHHEFIHRTIEEFMTAYYINESMLKNSNVISKNRVVSLFAKRGSIPTFLRGAYAWLCSLSEDDELIAIDPYYQSIHGDVSTYSSLLKKKVIKSIKSYSKEHPYFYDFQQSSELVNLYDQNLDEFYFECYENSINESNHFNIFLVNIMANSFVSDKMKRFLKNKINNKTPDHLVQYMLNSFEDDYEYLNVLVNKIESGEITDSSDLVKETLLSYLYPDNIKMDKVIEMISRYKNEVIGFCFYLYKTKYNDKFDLIDRIYRMSYDEKSNPKLNLPVNIVTFIEDYFLETILQYKRGLTAEEIYNVIKHFRKYYEEWEKIEYRSFRTEIRQKEIDFKHDMIKLGNSIFSLYIDDHLSVSNLDFYIYRFDDFFAYQVNINKSKVLLGKISKNNEKVRNETLFKLSYMYSKKSTKEESIFEGIAKEYNLTDLLISLKNPPKWDWEIEQEEYKLKKEKEREDIIKRNESKIVGKSDTEILRNLDIQFYTTQILLQKTEDIYVRESTWIRLVELLKKAIYSDKLYPELLSIRSLAETNPKAKRNIDLVYFVSTQLNETVEYKLIDDEFIKYLYIISVLNSNHPFSDKSSFIDDFEKNKKKRALEIVREYFKELICVYLPELIDVIMPIVEEEKDLASLKNIIIYLHSSSNKQSIQDTLVYNILLNFNFKLDCQLIIKLSEKKYSENTNVTIDALIKLHRNQKDDFKLKDAVAIFNLFNRFHDNSIFDNINKDLKVRIIDNYMNLYNTYESIAFVNGYISDERQCGQFLYNDALNYLDLESLEKLYSMHQTEDDIWKNIILDRISQKKSKKSDSEYRKSKLDNLKRFILNKDNPIDEYDFFNLVFDWISIIAKIIKANRDNQRKMFMNEDSTIKSEPNCRDVLLNLIKSKYDRYIDIDPEKNEGDNRVDINIKYKERSEWEVQIECKKDVNSKLYRGIKNQLIDKYMKDKVNYGLYLVFYTGKKDLDEMKTQLNEHIPEEYHSRIKVVIIDLSTDVKKVNK